MTRPADVKIRKAIKAGRPIKPGSQVQVDWDRVEQLEYLTGSLNRDDVITSKIEKDLAEEVQNLERVGTAKSLRKARKLRSQYNANLEAMVSLRNRWCYRCLKTLHVCECQVRVNKVSVDLIDRVTEKLNIGMSKKEKTIEARKLRKMNKKAGEATE